MTTDEASLINRQPTLRGELVHLRPTTEGDREPLFGIARDPLIWELHPANDRWQRPVFDAFFENGLSSGGALTVLDAAAGAIIGSTRFAAVDEARAEIEIGWTYLARRYWGGAHNGEMKRLMIDHVRDDVRAVTFAVGAGNARSRRALEKIGAHLRPEIQIRMMGSRPVEHLIYAIQVDRSDA